MRLFKGEDLDTLSRELGVTAATLSEWREAFGERPRLGAIFLVVLVIVFSVVFAAVLALPRGPEGQASRGEPAGSRNGRQSSENQRRDDQEDAVAHERASKS